MLYSDEKDYIMRIIKEVARVLFSLMLGKKYVQVELPEENKYEVSGRGLNEYLEMVDRGEINEAENLLLEGLNYDDPEEVAAAICFYLHISEKGEEFLKANGYSEEEVLEGLKQLADRTGYGEIYELME